MRYILIFLSISFAFGIIANYYLPIPFIWPLLLILFLIPSLFLYKTEKRFVVAISLMFFFLGIAYHGVSSYLPKNHIAHIELPQKTAIIGIVDSPVEVKRYSAKKTLTTLTISGKKYRSEKGWEKVQGKVKVNAYYLKNEIKYGDEIRVWGELTKPKKATNPGQFDYRNYLAKHGIHVLMSVYGDKCVKNYGPPKNRSLVRMFRDVPLRMIFDLRTKIIEKIDTHIEYPYNTILAALLIGYRSEIPQNIRDSFVKTGTVHILAISGLHISILTSIIFYVLLKSGVPRTIRVFVSLLFMLLYAAIAGFRFPIIRAVIMGFIFLCGFCMDRKHHVFNAISIALMFILLYNPESIFLAGVQLSFFAVLSITLFTSYIRALLPIPETSFYKLKWYQKIEEYILQGYSVSCAVIIGSVPLVFYYFYIFSLCTFLANLLIVPLVTIGILSGFIFVGFVALFPPVAFLLKTIPASILKNLFLILAVLSRIPGSFFYVAKPKISVVIGYYFIVGLLYLLRKRLGKKKMIIALSCICFGFTIYHLCVGFMESPKIHYLSAKTQPLTVITSKKTTILINTGYPSESQWVVKPFLASRGIQSIDALIIMGGYKRYWSGIEALQRYFKIKKIIVPHIDEFGHFRELVSEAQYMEKNKPIPINEFTFCAFSVPTKKNTKKLMDTVPSFSVSYRGTRVDFVSNVAIQNAHIMNQSSDVIALSVPRLEMIELYKNKRNPNYVFFYGLDNKPNHKGIEYCKKNAITCINPQYMGYTHIDFHRQTRPSHPKELGEDSTSVKSLKTA